MTPSGTKIKINLNRHSFLDIAARASIESSKYPKCSWLFWYKQSCRYLQMTAVFKIPKYCTLIQLGIWKTNHELCPKKYYILITPTMAWHQYFENDSAPGISMFYKNQHSLDVNNQGSVWSSQMNILSSCFKIIFLHLWIQCFHLFFYFIDPRLECYMAMKQTSLWPPFSHVAGWTKS